VNSKDPPHSKGGGAPSYAVVGILARYRPLMVFKLATNGLQARYPTPMNGSGSRAAEGASIECCVVEHASNGREARPAFSALARPRCSTMLSRAEGLLVIHVNWLVTRASPCQSTARVPWWRMSTYSQHPEVEVTPELRQAVERVRSGIERVVVLTDGGEPVAAVVSLAALALLNARDVALSNEAQAEEADSSGMHIR